MTPPHSPEEPSIPRRLSDGRTGSPPPPQIEADDNESDSTATADSDIEQATLNTRRNSGSLPPPSTSFVQLQQPTARAPYNPFAKTLATSEAAFGLRSTDDSNTGIDGVNENAQARPNGGRKPLDVDQFKNILLTGNATPSPPTIQQPPRPQDSSSSTDTSSISRQSIFDNMIQAHPESPRTSADYDHAQYGDDEDDDTDEHSSLMGPMESRPVAEGPPPPPKPKHGRAFPQTVSFADFDESIPAGFSSGHKGRPVTTYLTGILRPSTPRSLSDINKPLPPPPASQLSNEHVPAVPEKDVSPVQSNQPTAYADLDTLQAKRAPPPPPATRRAGQTGSTQGRPRSGSNLTQGSTQDGEQIEAASRASEPSLRVIAPPPPPPSRRTQPASATPSPAVETPPQAPSPNQVPIDARAMPPPPPRRSMAKIGYTLDRTPSNASQSSVPQTDSGQAMTVSSNGPPVPPSRRTTGSKRNSMDGHRNILNARNADHRRSSGQSFGSDRSTSITSLRQVEEPGERIEFVTSSATPEQPSRDILADMSAFQAEIEALRLQAAKGG